MLQHPRHFFFAQRIFNHAHCYIQQTEKWTNSLYERSIETCSKLWTFLSIKIYKMLQSQNQMMCTNELCEVTVTLTFDHQNLSAHSLSPSEYKFQIWRNSLKAYAQIKKIVPPVTITFLYLTTSRWWIFAFTSNCGVRVCSDSAQLHMGHNNASHHLLTSQLKPLQRMNVVCLSLCHRSVPTYCLACRRKLINF